MGKLNVMHPYFALHVMSENSGDVFRTLLEWFHHSGELASILEEPDNVNLEKVDLGDPQTVELLLKSNAKVAPAPHIQPASTGKT